MRLPEGLADDVLTIIKLLTRIAEALEDIADGFDDS